MKINILKQLILKDWYFHRNMVALQIAAGIIALLIIGLTSGAVQLIASILFIAAAGILIFIPQWTVIGERRDQTLPFIMSLPVSIMGYTIAKILSNTIVFLSVWVSLLIANIIFVTCIEPASAGSIPFTSVIFGIIFVLFWLNLSVALVTESDKVAGVVTMVSNISFWFFWAFFKNASVVKEDLLSTTIVWREPILRMLALELAIIPIILVVTLYLQSHKTDFI